MKSSKPASASATSPKRSRRHRDLEILVLAPLPAEAEIERPAGRDAPRRPHGGEPASRLGRRPRGPSLEVRHERGRRLAHADLLDRRVALERRRPTGLGVPAGPVEGEGARIDVRDGEVSRLGAARGRPRLDRLEERASRAAATSFRRDPHRDHRHGRLVVGAEAGGHPDCRLALEGEERRRLVALGVAARPVAPPSGRPRFGLEPRPERVRCVRERAAAGARAASASPRLGCGGGPSPCDSNARGAPFRRRDAVRDAAARRRLAARARRGRRRRPLRAQVPRRGAGAEGARGGDRGRRARARTRLCRPGADTRRARSCDRPRGARPGDPGSAARERWDEPRRRLPAGRAAVQPRGGRTARSGPGGGHRLARRARHERRPRPRRTRTCWCGTTASG